MSGPTCQATTARGHRCINQPLAGKRVCASHDPDRWCGAPTKNGVCKRVMVRGRDACALHPLHG